MSCLAQPCLTLTQSDSVQRPNCSMKLVSARGIGLALHAFMEFRRKLLATFVLALGGCADAHGGRSTEQGRDGSAAFVDAPISTGEGDAGVVADAQGNPECREPPPAPDECPAEITGDSDTVPKAACPKEGAACATKIKDCQEGSPQHWHCRCGQGYWDCARDRECTPYGNPDAGVVSPDGRVPSRQVDGCNDCSGDELCVQHYDGVGNADILHCVTPSKACAIDRSCSSQCEQEFCYVGHGCGMFGLCGEGEINCYGP